MAKLAIKKASTDVTTYVFIQDSSKTTGEGLAGLAYNTGSLVGYYVRPKGSATAITLATQTVTGDHSDGGFVEVDATNMPGVYRLDLPDAVCATGVPSVVVMLKGATDMSPVVLEIQLTDFDLNTAAITAAAVADAVWDEATADHTTASSFGALDANVDAILADTGTDGVVLKAAGLNADAVTKIQSGLALEATLTAIKGEGWTTQTLVKLFSVMATDDLLSQVEAQTSGIKTDLVDGGRLDLLIDAIKAKTDKLPADPAAVGSAMTLTAAYDKAKDDVLTPLGVVDGIVDAIKAKTDTIPATPASAGEYTANIGAIKAKTDNLPLSPASSGEYTSALTAIQNDLDNPNQYKADVSNLALQATSLAIKGQTDKIPAAPAVADEYDAALAAIQADLDNPAQYKADVSGLATTAHVQEVEGKVDIVDGILDDLHDTDIPAIKAETTLIVEDTGTTIPATLGTLATTAHVQEVEDKVDTADAVADAIKARTDQLTFTVANKVDATATTDTSNIAGDVWSYAKRTLTHPSVSAEEPEDSNTLILYRDADIAIELTDLTIPAGAKKYIFTIKDNLDGGDDQAVLQASYAIDGSEVETNTLVYINSAVPPALTNPVTFTLTETNITIDLTAEAAALLPRYERGYLNWDLKLVTDAAVTIVLQGLAQIIGTSTRAIE